MKLVVVYGACCSGKTTYVKDSMKKNDICFDRSMLLKATTNGEEHNEDKAPINELIEKFEEMMLESLKEFKGSKGKLYFVTDDLDINFEKYIKAKDIEYCYMDATREECLERLQNDETRKNKEYWAQKINVFFDKEEKD